MPAAVLPPPPGMFSITTCWPNASETFCATRRAITSVGPPAANGTSIRIGFVGYVCAKPSAAESAEISAAAMHAASARTVAGMGVLPVGEHAIIIRETLAVTPGKGRRLTEQKGYQIHGHASVLYVKDFARSLAY